MEVFLLPRSQWTCYERRPQLTRKHFDINVCADAKVWKSHAERNSISSRNGFDFIRLFQNLMCDWFHTFWFGALINDEERVDAKQLMCLTEFAPHKCVSCPDGDFHQSIPSAFLILMQCCQLDRNSLPRDIYNTYEYWYSMPYFTLYHWVIRKNRYRTVEQCLQETRRDLLYVAEGAMYGSIGYIFNKQVVTPFPIITLKLNGQ